VLVFTIKIVEIEIKKLSKTAMVPTRANRTDAGLDLYADQDLKLSPGEWKIVKTGIAIALPNGYAGLVLPRSGLAAKAGLTIMNSPGLIDPAYRGEVGVILTNLGKKVFNVESGMRIAQLLITKFEPASLKEVVELDKTDRGDGGFGSTGS
jgi:dUTP pyrophosphatase